MKWFLEQFYMVRVLRLLQPGLSPGPRVSEPGPARGPKNSGVQLLIEILFQLQVQQNVSAVSSSLSTGCALRSAPDFLTVSPSYFELLYWNLLWAYISVYHTFQRCKTFLIYTQEDRKYIFKSDLKSILPPGPGAPLRVKIVGCLCSLISPQVWMV